MRTIKFRAWDKENKKMFYDAQNCYDGSNYNGFKGFGWAECLGSLIDNEIPLMQYTGLKDKNGKEIYEGDVVEFTDTFDCENIGEIKYSDENMSFYFFDQHNDWDFKSDCPDDMTLEVIGNIFQNPELLVDKNL